MRIRAHDVLLSYFDKNPDGTILLDELGFPAWPDTDFSISDGKVWDIMKYRHTKPMFTIMQLLVDPRTERHMKAGFPPQQAYVVDLKKIKRAAVELNMASDSH